MKHNNCKIISMTAKQVETKEGPSALITVQVETQEEITYLKDYWVPSKTPIADSSVKNSFNFFFKSMETIGFIPKKSAQEILEKKELKIKDVYSSYPQFGKVVAGQDGVSFLLDPHKLFDIETEVKNGYEKIKYINDPDQLYGGAAVTNDTLLDMFGAQTAVGGTDEIPF